MLKHTSWRKNLRPDDASSGSSLIVATGPTSPIISRGWKPIVKVGNHLIVSSGAAIAVNGSLPIQLAEEPSFGIAINGRTFIVATPSKAYVVDIDGDTNFLKIRTNFDEMLPTLRAVDAGQVTTRVRTVDCNVASLQGGALSTADSRRFAQSATEAYEMLSRSAQAEGVSIHAVMARVRVLTAQGEQLFITEPTLLMHPEASDSAGRFEFESSATAAGFAVSADATARAWKPMLVMSDELLSNLPEGAIIEVLASEPLAAYDSSATPIITARMRSADPLVTVTLARKTHDYERLSLNADRHMSIAWATRHPLPARQFSFNHGEKAAKAVSQKLRIETARTAAATSSVIVWGAPTVRRHRAGSVDSYAATVSDAAWHGFVEVEFADGTRLVSASEGYTDAPLAFGPLISYPAADAVAMTLTVSTGGQVRTGRFALVADSEGNRSVYLHPSKRPFALPDVSSTFVIPAEVAHSDTRESEVAVALAESPLEAFTLAIPGAGRITAVATAASGESAWDFGRSRFYVFTTDGIYLLNVDPSRRTASVSLLDSRVVASASALVRVDDAIAAIASGDILLISGRKLKRIGRDEDAKALAYAHASHELWCLRTGETVAICLDHGYLKYTIPTAFQPTPVQADSATTYVAELDGTVRIAGHGDVIGMTPIGFSTVLDVPKSRGSNMIANYLLTLDMPGEYEDLTVKLTRTDTVSPAPGADYSITLSGRLSAPLRLPVALVRGTRRVLLEISGKASAGAKLLECRMER